MLIGVFSCNVILVALDFHYGIDGSTGLVITQNLRIHSQKQTYIRTYVFISLFPPLMKRGQKMLMIEVEFNIYCKSLFIIIISVIINNI